MENLTDLVKISISENLNVRTLCAEISSNLSGADGRSFQMNERVLEKNNVDKVFGTSSVDGLRNFEEDEATSRAPAVRSRLTEGEPGKRKSN